jgi:hypothetical protein
MVLGRFTLTDIQTYKLRQAHDRTRYGPTHPLRVVRRYGLRYLVVQIADMW